MDRPRRGVAVKSRRAMASGQPRHRHPDKISGRDEKESVDQVGPVPGLGVGPTVGSATRKHTHYPVGVGLTDVARAEDFTTEDLADIAAAD